MLKLRVLDICNTLIIWSFFDIRWICVKKSFFHVLLLFGLWCITNLFIMIFSNFINGLTTHLYYLLLLIGYGSIMN